MIFHDGPVLALLVKPLLYLNGNFRVINQIENIIRVKPFF